MRLYEHDAVMALLTEAGFVNIDVCGDYSEEAAAVTAKEWLCFSDTSGSTNLPEPWRDNVGR